jgi:hypothetical protein
MSRKLSGPRSKSILSETLDRRLKMYSLAASAAGVSMLAAGVNFPHFSERDRFPVREPLSSAFRVA